MNIKNFIPAVLSILGLDKFREADGKKVLNSADEEALKGYGFSEKFIEAFKASLNESDEAAQPANAQVAAVAAMLAQVTQEADALRAEVAALKNNGAANAAELEAKAKKIAELEAKVSVLSNLPDLDTAAAAGNGDNVEAVDLNDEKQLGGRQGAFFALDRPYNKRARAALLGRRGMSVSAPIASAMDYSTLKEDLGAFYRQTWSDRLQSFLAVLPTVETIFPLQSGYQDLATLVNIWLGEFSQADNTIGSDFDRVTKGNYDFGTETLRMFGVMFAHKFKNLKEIERLWIGSLNAEGSNPIKWSFIEYLLVETAKKLHNEREIRRINGVRKNPNANEPGRALEAADGLYEFLRKKVEGHIDYTVDGGLTGRTVYQLKPFVLGEITELNIGEIIYKGTSMIPAEFRDTGNIGLYMPSYMVAWYHKYNETIYGKNQDYKAGEMYVHEFPAVKIIPVPNADNHQRIFWTIIGNIKTYEHVAGEMLNFSIEQQDWSLKVWSNWKESIWAEAVGFKYTDPREMDGSRQLIWLNEYDMPASYFVKGDTNANPSVLRHSSVETVANSALYTITDIDGAKEGQVVSVKCGVDGDKGVKIEKSGNFSLISADWAPSKGDVIRLMKRADGKFIEIDRITAANEALSFAADDTTPSVANSTLFVTGNNTAATAITELDDATTGVVYTIYGNGSTHASTIANSGNFVLTAAMTLSAGHYIKVVKAADGKFYEVARG